ncbi:hypothetical protein SBA4_2450006 [Candidatus Sulfopaludibacter sp. SbA4]|nr:hypothetical protein SBA4_2450006 [Candidatus Sulfopaludibacter sp. SbA4]
MDRDRKCVAQVCLFVALLPYVARAQWISVGMAGAVPAPRSEAYDQVIRTFNPYSGCLDRTAPGCSPDNNFFVKPYAFGPTADVNLPWGVSAEVGFLYERFHRDLTEGLIAPHGGSVNFGQQYSASADGWAFPLLLKYTFGRRRFAPFVDAGATLRHLGAFDGKGIQLDFHLQPQPISVHIESGRDLDVAITAGAGLRWRVFLTEAAPEIRFLHWTATYYQPVQNQVMIVLSIRFPAVR